MPFGSWPNPPGNTDTETGAAQLLSPLEDPDRAFQTALQQQGYNPYRANPFLDSLKRSSRGLRQAYIQNRATSTDQYSDPSSSSVAQDYNSYLRGVLSSPTGISDTLNRAYAGVKPAISAVRSYQDQLANGGVAADQANPFLQLLADEMSANNGQGTANALTYLRAPLMGGQLAKSYSGMLSDVVNSALTNFATDPTSYQPGGGRDIWSYIFGTEGSPF